MVSFFCVFGSGGGGGGVEDVGRLEVAVHKTQRGEVVEGLEHLVENAVGEGEKLPPGQGAGEGVEVAVHQVHEDLHAERFPAVGVERADDVFVVEAREDYALSAMGGLLHGSRSSHVGHDFDGEEPARGPVACLVHGAERTAAQLVEILCLFG